MTKEHFKAIAEIIRKCVPVKSDNGSPALMNTAKEFADFFATQNPHFDRSKFLTACGTKE